MLNLYKAVSEPMGVSGREDGIREKLHKLCPPSLLSTTDHIGNVFWYQRERKDGKIFTAHMDELGVMVKGHNDEGLLEFATVGGFDNRVFPNSHVRFANGERGVIGLPAPHGRSREELERVLAPTDLTIDCGFAGKEEAEKRVPVGTTGVIDMPLHAAEGGTVFSRNADNRTGVAVLVALAWRLHARKCIHDVTFAFLVQEEVGLYGARTVLSSGRSYRECVNVDVTNRGKLGEGCLINIKDGGMITSAAMVERLEEAGFKHKEVGGGGTSDHTMMQFTCPSAGIGIPSRYIHSSVSSFHLDDLKEAVDKLEAYCG